MKYRSFAAVVLALLTSFAHAAVAKTICHASMDQIITTTGSGTFKAPDTLDPVFTKGRLNQGLKLNNKTGPLTFTGTAESTDKGLFSFWLGSLDLAGYDKKTVHFATLDQDTIKVTIFKGRDAYVYAHVEHGDTTETFRYPIYDLLPNYPEGHTYSHDGGAVKKGSPDIRHFFVYQWGDKNRGFYVNTDKAEPCSQKIDLPERLSSRDGELILGDNNASLVFDEVMVTDQPLLEAGLSNTYVSMLVGKYSLPKPLLTVTQHAGKQITIDGTLDHAEWGSASALGGVHHLWSKQIIPYEATFYFTYDKERFYIAARTFADYPLKSEGGTRGFEGEDTKVCMDDCLEVILMPYDSISFDYFHWLGNSVGYFADQRGTDTSWDGGWEYKTQVKNGVWTSELAIPYANMKSDDDAGKYPNENDSWRFTVARNFIGALPFHWFSLTYGGSYGDFWSFGIMNFQKRGLSPRYKRITEEKDSLRFEVEVANTDSKPRKAVIKISGYTAPLPFTTVKKTVTVKPGGKEAVELTLPLKGVTKCSLEWTVTDGDTEKVLLRGSGNYPFVEGKAEEYKKMLAARQADKEKLAQQEKETAGTGLAEKGKKTGEALLWPTREAVNKALDERLKWKNNRLGYSDDVPPPWTDVNENEGVVSVWARDYDFADQLILGQATIKGKDILAGPVALVMEKAGKQIRYESAETTVTSRKPTRVELFSVGGDSSLTITTKTWIEYDGCIWVEMKLQPNEDNVSFDRMWLDIPYKPELAPRFSYWRDKSSSSDCGELPPEGLTATHRPYIWLGDVDQGLCWFHNNLREWFVPEPTTTKMTFIEPGGETGSWIFKKSEPTRVKIMISPKPNTLKKVMALEFGLMATPVRPLPENWRQYDHYCGWSKLKGQFSEWGTGYFVKWPDDETDFAKRLKRYDEASPYIIALPNCGSYFYRPTNFKDGKVLPDHWLWGKEFAQTLSPDAQFERQAWKAPKDPDKYIGGYTTATPYKNYQDWYLYRYSVLMKAFPLLKGVYEDTCIPVAGNRLNGTGYFDRYGQWQREYQIMNSREFSKRLYTMFWKLRGNPDDNPWVIYVHCSNQICPPIHSFATSLLQGEGLSVGHRALGRHPLEALPMKSLQVGYNSHPYGFIHHFLHKYSTNPREDAELSAMFLMHDHSNWGRGTKAVKQRVAVYRALSGVNCADDEIVFYPYWDNRNAAYSPTEGGYVNTYVKTKENRVILVASSLGLPDAPTKIRVNLDRQALALGKGILTIRDLYTGETFTISNNSFTLPIRKNDFRTLEVTDQHTSVP